MRKFYLLAGILMLSVSLVYAQRKQKKAPAQPAQSTLDADLYKGLKWRNIGPYRGGRSNAISGVVNNNMVYYTGYTGGGVWKTENAGASWKNISDGFFKSGSVGEIAISESDPNVIYVGMGEHAVRGVMTTYGDGVYKSTDAGATWKNMGLEKTRHISEIAVHPTNPDVVLVGAQGAVHGPSSDRGVYKSVDGGATWKRTLYVDENTGVSSLNMDMNNPRILYAATWDHRRLPWKVVSGGPGSALWKSTDGGDTWKKIVEGLPKELGKMGVAVSRANSNRVYAIVETEKSKSGLYRSDDGGNKWTLLSNNQDISSRSWYYMEVFPDPINEDIVYVLNAPVMRSIDGGKNFSRVSVGHGDTHDLWINPKDNNNMILGDDGGGEITFNRGDTWSTQGNQPTAQFYRVAVDNVFPYNVYGGQQDNSSVVIASRTNSAGITERDWFNGPGCESAFIVFDPENPEKLMGGCYQGNIDVLDINTGESKDVREDPATYLAYEAKDMKYRFNWNAPIVSSIQDKNTIYHAGNVVFKSTDWGQSWVEISPDLTRNEEAKQGVGGGPFTNEGAGGENYNTISYLAVSPHEKDVIYTGSDCGLVHVTRDGGKNWENITPPGVPESLVSSIEVSPFDKGTAYVAITRYKFNDFSNMAYKTTDYGKTWTKLGGGVDQDDFIKVVREDKKVKDLLYAGSERGFYISYNGGSSWSKFQLNLPVVPITDLVIHDNDLVAATQGRAFWILDDLGAIQQSKGKFGEEKVKLYTPKPTYRLTSFSPSWMSLPPNVGQNPMNGVILDYYLKEKADSNVVSLQIQDLSGNTIRSYSNIKDKNFKPYPGGPPAPQIIPAEAGINRFAWDFRYETIKDVPNAFVYGSYNGHRVGPGRYKAVISYGGETSSVEFEVIPDPRVKATAAQWAEQQQFLTEVESTIEDIHGSINSIREVKKQVALHNEVLKSKDDAKEVVEAGEQLLKKIESWESNVIETRQKNGQDVINWPSKLNAEFFQLLGVADSHDPVLTKGVKDRRQEIESQWSNRKQEIQQLIDKDIAAYNEMFKSENIPAVVVKKKDPEKM
ncbi:MAG: glycosyl hydrolase [Cyclobacteriaceae bacterium]|nr:glycosyl hydrolase [Cyclobacteriaceae bacterium]